MLPEINFLRSPLDSELSSEEIFVALQHEMLSIMPYAPYLEQFLQHPNATDEVYAAILKINHLSNPLRIALEALSYSEQAGTLTAQDTYLILHKYPRLPISDESAQIVRPILQSKIFPNISEPLPPNWVLRAWQGVVMKQSLLTVDNSEPSM